MREASLKFLYSLTFSMFFACGLEPDQEADSGNVAASEVALREAEVRSANGDVPGGAPAHTRLVVAKNAVAGSQPATISAVKYGLLLIDRSGSMTTRRTNMHTRCEDAINQALNEQLTDMANSNVTNYAVWSFAGSAVTQHTAGYVLGIDQAKAAVNNVATVACSGNTPLADSMCLAIDNLRSVAGGQSSYLAVSTDGLNNTSTGVCSGPSGDIDTAGTWQNKVKNKINAAGLAPIKIANAYWVDPALLTFQQQNDGSSLTALCSSPQSCDEKFFAATSDQTGGNYRRVADDSPAYPCASAAACPAPDSTKVGNHFTFTASNTAGGTVNTANYSVYLLGGETITLGTCGVEGASGVGDSIVRLVNPAGVEIAVNDDSCGLLSNLTATVPADGTYLVRVGCFSSNGCSGTVAFTIQGSFNYSASQTSNATINTVNRSVYLRPAQRISFGTCGVTGASGTGDTFLRLFAPSGSEVAFNDDSCGLLSNLSYGVPSGAAGTHQIHAGCFSSFNCSGTVPYLITEPLPINLTPTMAAQAP